MSTSETSPFSPTTKYLVCVCNSAESKVALKLACWKAQAANGLVDILHVISPADFQTLSTVAERMQAERYEEAKTLLHTLSEEAYNICGVRPSLLIREGQIGEQILQAAKEDADLDMLVVGASQQSKGGGALSSWLASHLGKTLHIPLLLVPGNLTDQQIMALV